jgi:hypothetical protein
MMGVGAFWADANHLFETARRAAGCGDCDWAILIGPQGEIRVLDATGWALPSLLADRGAETAYRVRRDSGRVWLEGRHGAESCLLRSESPAETSRQLLSGPIPWHLQGGGGRALQGVAVQETSVVKTWQMLA